MKCFTKKCITIVLSALMIVGVMPLYALYTAPIPSGATVIDESNPQWEWVQIYAAGAFDYQRDYVKRDLRNDPNLWSRLANPASAFGPSNPTNGTQYGDGLFTGVGLFVDGISYRFGHGAGDYRRIYRQPNRDLPDFAITEITWDIRWHFRGARLYLLNVEFTDGTVADRYYVGDIFNRVYSERDNNNTVGGYMSDGFSVDSEVVGGIFRISIWFADDIVSAEAVRLEDFTGEIHNWSTVRNGDPDTNTGPNPRRTFSRYCSGFCIDAMSAWYRRPIQGGGDDGNNQRGHTIGRSDCGGLFYTDTLSGFVHIGVTEEELIQAVASINGYILRFTTTGRFTLVVPVSTESELRSMAEYLTNAYPHIFHRVSIVNSFVGIDYAPTQGGEVSTYFRPFNTATEPRRTNESDDFWTSSNSWNLRAINADYAWALLYENEVAQVTKVGVVDTAIMHNHEDLMEFGVGNTMPNIVNLPANAIQFPEDVTAIEMITFERDRFQHGSYVIGVMGAVHDNNRGLAGVMDITRSNLYSRDVFYSTVRNTAGTLGPTTSVIRQLDAFYDLVTSGVRIINYSLGTTTDATNPDFADEMQRLLAANYEFLIVSGAGNAATNARRGGGWAYVSEEDVCHNDIPLRDRIITVGAVEAVNIHNPQRPQRFRMASFTNYGSRVDVVAPGVTIFSTVRGVIPKDVEQGIYEDWFYSAYDTASGTSMASPHVAAVAGMVWDANPSLTGAEVKSIITASARGNSIMHNRLATEHRTTVRVGAENRTITPSYQGATYYMLCARNAVLMALGYLPFRLDGVVVSMMPPMWGENPDIYYILRTAEGKVVWSGYVNNAERFTIHSALYVGQDNVIAQKSQRHELMVEVRADGFPPVTRTVRILPNNIVDHAVPLANNDITSSFRDPVFLAFVLELLGKSEGDRILAYEVANITDLHISTRVSPWSSAFETHYAYYSDNADAWAQYYDPYALWCCVELEEYIDIVAFGCWCYIEGCCDDDCWCDLCECGLIFISNLAGIEHFLSLTHLTVAGGGSSIDLSYNTALQTLDIFNAFDLRSIDISNNALLQTLIIEGAGQLSRIDLSGSPQLQHLAISSWGGLTALDVSYNTQLRTLDVSSDILTGLTLLDHMYLDTLSISASTQFATLGIQGASNLENFSFFAFSSPLTSLNFSDNPNLQYLRISSRNLTNINLLSNLSLRELQISSADRMAEINLSNNTMLRSLTFTGTGLTSLNLSNNTSLEDLRLSTRGITNHGALTGNLDLSNNTALQTVSISSRLRSISLPHAPQLTSLSINGANNSLIPGGTGLIQLDLSGLPNLRTLNLDGNSLATLNLSHNTQLTSVMAPRNNLLSINLPSSPHLQTLFLSENRLTNINLSNNPDLRTLTIANNALNSISLANNANLRTLSLMHNQLTSDSICQGGN